MVYGIASTIPGPNVKMFVLGSVEGEGDGTNWARPRGAEVGLTGIGGSGC